jgi:hypothetical protein
VLAIRQARAWNTAGQPQRAVAALEDWLRREPDSPEALDLLAQMDVSAGRMAQAERRFEALLARQPGNAPALNNLAWILGERAETRARARDLAERAFLLLPNPETADTLGWILARQGETARALPLLRQAAAASFATPAPNRGIAYRLAVTLRMSGESEEAGRVLDRVAVRRRALRRAGRGGTPPGPSCGRGGRPAGAGLNARSRPHRDAHRHRAAGRGATLRRVLMWSWVSFMNPHQLGWGMASSLPLAQTAFAVTVIGCIVAREPRRLPLNAVTILMLVLLACVTVTSFQALGNPALSGRSGTKC